MLLHWCSNIVKVVPIWVFPLPSETLLRFILYRLVELFVMGLRCKFLPTNFYRSILYIQLTPIANFRTTYPLATIKSNINSIRVSRIGTINILVTHCRIVTPYASYTKWIQAAPIHESGAIDFSFFFSDVTFRLNHKRQGW